MKRSLRYFNEKYNKQLQYFELFLLLLLSILIAVTHNSVLIIVYLVGLFISILRNPKTYIYYLTLIWPFTYMSLSFNLYLRVVGIVVGVFYLFKYKKNAFVYKFQKFYLVFFAAVILSYILSLFYKLPPNTVSNYKQVLGFSSLPVQNLVQYVFIFCFLIIFGCNFRTKKEIYSLINLFINVGVVSCIFGIVIYLLDYYKIPFYLPNIIRYIDGRGGVWENRLLGTAFEPLAFGNQVAVLIMLTAARFFLLKGEKNAANIIFLIIEVATLVLCFSTGAWISCFMSNLLLLAVLFIKGSKNNYVSFRKILTYVLYVLICIVLLNGFLKMTNNSENMKSTVIDKFNNSQSISERTGMNITLLRTWKSNPIFGVGIGNFVYYIEKYAPESQFEYIPVPVPATWRANNDYLTILAETGAVGLGTFILLFIVMLKWLLDMIKKVRLDNTLVLYLGSFCSITVIVIQMSAAFLVYNIYFWLIIGISLNLREIINDSDTGKWLE